MTDSTFSHYHILERARDIGNFKIVLREQFARPGDLFFIERHYILVPQSTQLNKTKPELFRRPFERMPKNLRDFIRDHRQPKHAIQFRLWPVSFLVRSGDGPPQHGGSAILHPLASLHSLCYSPGDSTPAFYQLLAQCFGPRPCSAVIFWSAPEMRVSGPGDAAKSSQRGIPDRVFIHCFRNFRKSCFQL
jgi:hypothetical protein